MDRHHGGYLSLSLCLAFTAFALIFLGAPSVASGAEYFINNQSGSNCTDTGPHTQAHRWCSFAPIDQVQDLSVGDQLLLARGATWDEQLTLTGSGSPAQPITLGAYGTGSNPRIIRSQATGDICVLLTNVSYWNIEHLAVGNASVGLLLHYTNLFHEGVAINDVPGAVPASTQGSIWFPEVALLTFGL